MFETNARSSVVGLPVPYVTCQLMSSNALD